MKTLPPPVQNVIASEVPLLVEDYPSKEVCREMEIEFRDELCGLFTGTAITERSIEHAPQAPESVIIYREGIIAQALERDDSIPDEYFESLADDYSNVEISQINEILLDEEIRITILHEYGHLHGLNEDDLERFGYA